MGHPYHVTQRGVRSMDKLREVKKKFVSKSKHDEVVNGEGKN